MDGYRIAGAPGALHIASLKGVIADEVRFESGLTRLTMGMQARCERLHVHRAARVLVTSRYSGERAQQFYGLERFPTVVPELIDLAAWRRHLADFAAPRQRSASRCSTWAASTAASASACCWKPRPNCAARSPNLEIRIVGNGPCDAAWRAQAGQLKLGEHGHLAGRHFARRPGRRVQPRRRLLPAQRAGRLRHRAAGSHGGG